MGANSLPRRFAKAVLAPLLNENIYSLFQAVAMGWDIRRGAWSEPELELIAPALREGETALDIGANYGLYAYHLSKAVGPRGKVYCFEPVPFTARTFRRVQRGLRFAHNVELIAKGASDKSEWTTFDVPVMPNGAISAGLVHMGRNDERPGKESKANFQTKKVRCEVVKIDEFLPNLSDLALVKCDIEGADLYAMRGMRRTLETHRPTVIIEITPWYLEGFGLRVTDVTEFFEELGYRCYRYTDHHLTSVRPDEIVEDNWIFVHSSRRARFDALLRDETPSKRAAGPQRSR